MAIQKESLRDYQRFVRDTYRGPKAQYARVLFAGCGIGGEAGEVVDHLKKVGGHGKKLDKRRKDEIAEELGDLLWYIALTANIIGADLNNIISLNISKLMKRQRNNQGAFWHG